MAGPNADEGNPLDVGTIYVQKTGGTDDTAKLREALKRFQDARGLSPPPATEAGPLPIQPTPSSPVAPEAAPTAPPGPLQARAQAMVGTTPTEGMSPDRAALARSVFGMADKGAAYLDQKVAGAQQTIADMPSTLPEFMDRVSQPANMRGILRGSGAAAGGMAGTPGGPAGIVLGTAAGSALGSYMANVYDDVKNYVSGTPAQDKPALAQRLLQPMVDAAHDAAFTGAVISVPGASREAKNLLARVLKIPPNSGQLLAEASSLGVDIGVANVANGGVGKGAVNVFGRMPLLGGSARAASAAQGKSIVKAYDDMFGAIANPTSTTEIGEAALAAARAQYGDFASQASRRYEHAMRVGEEAGSFLKSDRILRATGQILADMSSSTGKFQGVPPADIKTYLNGLVRNVGDTVSTVDIANISIGVENLLRKTQGAQGVHYSKLEGLQKALDDTLRSVDHPSTNLMRSAKEFFTNGIKEFETNIYQKMVGKVDRNIFAIGKVKGGTLTADDIMEVAERTSSARGVQELRAAAGDDTVRHVARARLDDAWVKATGKEPGTFFIGDKLSFNADKFKSALGLDNPNSVKYGTMKEMLRGTGIEIQDVEKLAKVAESVVAAPIADASTFMARAAVLKGSGGVAEAVKGAMTLGAAGKTAQSVGMPSAIAGMLMMRWGLGAMMKPGLLKAITQAGDVSLGTAVNTAAILQMASQYPNLFNE